MTSQTGKHHSRRGPGNLFQKGHTVKSPGRPKLSELLEGVEQIKPWHFRALVSKYLQFSPTEFDKAKKDPNITMLDKMICSIVEKSVVLGDHMRLNALLDRLIGAVPKIPDVQVINYNAEFGALPIEDLLKLLREEPKQVINVQASTNEG